MLDFHVLGLLALSYVAGAVPTGYLAAKGLRGIDIREHGSGNPGTANVYRIAGPLAGAITLAVDALKGFLPTLLALRLYPDRPAVHILTGASAIVGHDWTIFLGLRGGKGVATSAGVFAALMPWPTACTIMVFAAAVVFSGHISVGSMIGSLVMPAFGLAFGVRPDFVAMAAAACALILYKHIPNIRRLREQKELHLHEKKY